MAAKGDGFSEHAFIGHAVPRKFDGRRHRLYMGYRHLVVRKSRARPTRNVSVVKGGRAGRSVGAPVEHGLVSLVLIGKIDGLVLAWREIHVAEHLAAARALAFNVDHEGGAFALLAQDRAQAEDGIDVAPRNLHA